MPELLMERPKMSLQMHETLKKYIIRERRKKKEEDELSEQKIREEMKKVEMNTQTLEQNKAQLNQLEIKLEDLQLKRRDLFNQLKKVLNEETNLKKNNRPPITLAPQSSIPLQMNGQNIYNYQQLVTNQHQNSDDIFFNMNGLPQIINQSNGSLSIPSAKTPPSTGILPRSSQSISNNASNNGGHVGNSKPQSPFHPPQITPHLGSNFTLIPPGGLKYGLQTSLSPQILSTHQRASPSSSPRHNSTSSLNNANSNQTSISVSTPNSKRPRSPSPQLAANSIIQQFVFNQNQLTPSRSPAIHSSHSPPPSQSTLFSNSPSSSKKSRNNLLASGSSPANPNSQIERQQSRQTVPVSINSPNGLTPQQQSAFSAYHQSLVTGRPGNLQNSFQSTQQSSQQSPHNKPNKSPSLPQFNHPQSNQPNFIRNSGNLQLPQLPPPSQSPLNFNTMTNHYLQQLAQEATQKIFKQQQAQVNIQQHLMHQQQIQMLSAAAAAAAAAEIVSNGGRSSSSSTSTGAGGSILTGFSRSSTNPQQQKPPSNY